MKLSYNCSNKTILKYISQCFRYISESIKPSLIFEELNGMEVCCHLLKSEQINVLLNILEASDNLIYISTNFILNFDESNEII